MGLAAEEAAGMADVAADAPALSSFNALLFNAAFADFAIFN